MRGVTWVRVKEFASGEWAIGGKPLDNCDVKAVQFRTRPENPPSRLTYEWRETCLPSIAQELNTVTLFEEGLAGLSGVRRIVDGANRSGICGATRGQSGNAFLPYEDRRQICR